jgi:FtsX-like permease family
VLRFAAEADPVTVNQELSADLGLPPPPEAALTEDVAFVDAAPLVEVRNIDQLALLLGVLMSLMSMAVLADVLVSAALARRGELALLRAIGLDQRQIRRTVASQTATTAVVALVIAVPLGIVVGSTVCPRRKPEEASDRPRQR